MCEAQKARHAVRGEGVTPLSDNLLHHEFRRPDRGSRLGLCNIRHFKTP